MKIAFMGTPDFAVPSLIALHESGHQVDLVITKPDAIRDRGKKIKETPVKTAGKSIGAKVIQPEKVQGNQEFLDELIRYKPEIIVVVAYGQILTKEILELAPLGCVNIHASLLPKYRGAAPIQRAILDGEEETGVSLMYVEEKLDAGPVIATRKTRIGTKTSKEMFEELAILGSEMLVETLPLIARGEIKATPQREEQATYAAMIFKNHGEIDFSQGGETILRQIQAMNPWPGAYTKYGEHILKIWEGSIVETSRIGDNNAKRELGDGKKKHKPGTILQADDEGIEIVTGDGVLLAKKIQLPGKKPMAVKDFLRGNNIELLYVLG